MIFYSVVSGSGVSREEFIDNIATEILGKIPPEYDMMKIKRNFGLSVSPTTIVLFQELERFNKLIRKMTTTLEQLRKVIYLSFCFNIANNPLLSKRQE